MHYRPFVTAAAICALASSFGGTAAAQNVDWDTYGGNEAGTRYSELTQINRDNVGQLQEVWRRDLNSNAGLQNQPIVIDGVLYGSGGGVVFAVDAATGVEKWTYNPGDVGARTRGASWWTDGTESRLFVGAGTYIYCLDPATGQPIASFGDGGRINLNENLRGAPEDNSMRPGTPPNIYKDLLISSGGVGETRPASPGDVRAWDVHTGELRWTFHTIPHPGEAGYDSWPEDAYLKAGGANSWAGNVLDEERGILYVATGSASDDFYGGERLGDNLFADSIIALNAETGERIWHFQTVHHDLWDFDFASPPTLVTFEHDGKMVDAVVGTNKTSMVYVLDRDTGEPIFPIEEVPVPQNVVEGDVASPTQPMALIPPPLSRTSVSAEELTNRTPEANAWAREKLKSFVNGPIFTPPQLGKETIVAPGFSGGAEWGGMSFDPKLQYLFVNTENIVWTTAVLKRPELPAGFPALPEPHSQYTFSGYNKFYDPDGYPAVAPPWGNLTAIDLKTGEYAWRIPFGQYPELAEKGMTDTGTENYGGSIATASGLLFIGATNFDRKLHVYDSRTGEVVWETTLPYAGNATPAMYMVDGRQYIVIATSSARDRSQHREVEQGSAFVAYALPE